MKKTIKSRCFALVLYPEDKHHIDILNFIKSNFTYAYILHNKDIDDDGLLKKPHIHVILKFPNARSIDSIKKILNIDYIETCNFYFYSRYLIHLDNPDKFQYQPFHIITNMPSNVFSCFDTEFSSSELNHKILLNYINTHGHFTFLDLCNFAFEHDCSSELKKYAFYYKCIIERR